MNTFVISYLNENRTITKSKAYTALKNLEIALISSFIYTEAECTKILEWAKTAAKGQQYRSTNNVIITVWTI